MLLLSLSLWHYKRNISWLFGPKTIDLQLPVIRYSETTNCILVSLHQKRQFGISLPGIIYESVPERKADLRQSWLFSHFASTRLHSAKLLSSPRRSWCRASAGLCETTSEQRGIIMKVTEEISWDTSPAGTQSREIRLYNAVTSIPRLVKKKWCFSCGPKCDDRNAEQKLIFSL